MLDRRGTKGEDSAQFQAHERMGELAERREWQPVLHVVHDGGPTIVAGEAMAMDPELVRAVHLLIDERVGRVPMGDARAPAQWDAEETQTIVDDAAFVHHHRWGCEDLERKLRRRDTLEIGGISEEGEDGALWQRYLLLSRKDVAHGLFRSAMPCGSRENHDAS